MIQFPVLVGLGVFAAAAASIWSPPQRYGADADSDNAMQDAFGRLASGELMGTPEAYGAIIVTPSALRTFIAKLPSKNAKQLYNESVNFVTHYLGNFKALRNQGKFTDQYAKFKSAVLAEKGLGARAMKEAGNGVRLIEAVSGQTVSSQDRQALAALAKYQAGMILKGQG